MGLLAALATLTLAASPAAADELITEPILQDGQLIYPPNAAIPRYLTEVEEQYLRAYPQPMPRAATPPPTGPLHCVAEYEPMQAIIMNWNPWISSVTTLLRQMAKEITVTGQTEVWMVVDSATEESTVTSSLSSYGVDMDRVRFFIRNTDSIWIRDYGPRYVYEGDCRVIVDHTYNRPRPQDNLFNTGLATMLRHARYELPLTHGGGNYHLDALGDSYATRLINNENPALSEAQIIGYWQSYQNVTTNLFTPFPKTVDSTQHIDMWMQVIADDKVVISDWPAQPGTAQDAICDSAAAWFAGRGFTVYRTPARSVSGVHYTYTNVVMANGVVLVPSYTNSTIVAAGYNAQALSVFQNALPDRTIRQLDCQGIVSSAGVMHCIVMHVPVPRGGENPTAYLQTLRGGEVLVPGTTADIRWVNDDDVYTNRVNLYLSTDAGRTFPTVIASSTTPDGQHTWTVPDLNTARARIRVEAVDGDGNVGYDESASDLTIGEPPADANDDGRVDDLDTAVLASCLGGPDASPAPKSPRTAADCLAAFDADADGDVDLSDAAVYQRLYNE